ncbi:MAG: UvrD-helicase domain-containing protein [Candidatus Binatia bacterium]
MTLSYDLPDAPDRERAVTTFDRNVVVTAGAGTGKTTLLVDRLVHLLMREPQPLKITEIVALTFTKKAANEMKVRLRERLQSYLGACLDKDPTNKNEEKVHAGIQSLIDRYHLTKDHIDSRAREALRHIERSEIGTIHSFAATVLRLYPMEAGLDPQFREDDGTWFERYFEESWAVWLDQELSGRGARKEDWKQVLRKISLEEMRSLASALCSETLQLEQLAELTRNGETPQPIRAWLKKLEEVATNLIGKHPNEKHQIDKLTHTSLKIIREFLQRGELVEGMLAEEKTILAEKGPRPVKAWCEDEFEQAKELVRVATRLCQINRQLLRLICDLLIPFAVSCQEGFAKEGFVSFDGLLVRARNLLRDHMWVREELKGQYKALLIDEFQDTDPIQYEILVYLAEEEGRNAKDWRKVKLEPGKVFVVGDPKQSIYAFRRADIEAYMRVVIDVIKAQNGIECTLTTNFRGHSGILDVVNGVFAELIQPRDTLQPPYVAIHPADTGIEDQNGGSDSFPFRQVQLRRVESVKEVDADLGRRMEAESLARWLSEEVIGKAMVLDANRRAMPVRAGDVAILMRSLTHVDQYLEPLRRHKIRYVVEGERHFYAAQEVIDAVNLLRAVENPCDRTALVGVLRSPVGGLKDTEIYHLHRRDLLDYRNAWRFKGAVKKKSNSLVKDLYETLNELHAETRKLPVGEAISYIFARLPIRILAAHSINGEQAVANLEKVQLLAEKMGRQGTATLKEVISRLERRVLDLREEGESALAEETVDAVKILSVHKAKGLEFPIVVLAGCHMATDYEGGEPVEVYSDWSTNLVGLRVGDLWSLSGIFLGEKKSLREEEEQKRVLYVAATRAREHLAVSCASTGKRSSGSFLSMLEQAVGDLTSSKESKIVPIGNGKIELNVATEPLGPPRQTLADRREDQPKFDRKAYADLWNQRVRIYDEAILSPPFVTPTLLKAREEELAGAAKRVEKVGRAGERALFIGELAHRFLQHWDFSMKPETFHDTLLHFLTPCPRAGLEENWPAIQKELEEIFQVFFFSPAYRELRSSRILGREIPLLTSRNTQVMEGVIDVLYEKEGNLYVADFKTDRVRRGDLSQVLKSYHHQAEIYSEAVRRSVERDVAGFKLIFLRLGKAISVL